MIKNYLEIGQIVSTHGIRGEVRINPWCNGPEFVKKFKTLYKDANGKDFFKVVSCRPHKNVAIVKVGGIDTIEQAEKFRGKIVYISRKDAKLPKDKYFVQDLLGCTVFDADDGKVYGEISDVSKTGANDVWHIKNGEKEYLIPVIDDVVINVDVADNKIEIRPLKGIFDDED